MLVLQSWGWSGCAFGAGQVCERCLLRAAAAVSVRPAEP